MRFRRAAHLGLPILLLLAGLACNDDKKTTEPPDDLPAVASDFALPDVNPNSATNGTSISPRDYLGAISCWYFTEST